MLERTTILAILAALLLGACECERPGQYVEPPDVNDAEPVAADDFADRLVDRACSSYRTCSDDVFRGGVFHIFVLPVETSFDDETPADLVDEYRRDYDQLQETVQARTPPTLPEDQCERFTRMLVAFLGLRADQIDEARQKGNAEYDPEAAGRCIERVGAPPSPCQRDRRARGDEFNMQQYGAIASQHEREIEEHYEPCRQILSGTLPEDAECRYIYECAEGNCEWFADAEAGRCGPQRRGSWLVP